MKTRVQAQHLMPGDVVGTGEVVHSVIVNSIHWPSHKVYVALEKHDGTTRSSLWGKRTMINVERKDGNSVGR